MNQPKLVLYKTIHQYKIHYEREYCNKRIKTFDGIPVFFRKNRFEHCFFESTKRNKSKDKFSKTRAERIDWIKATLQNPEAKLYQGWDNVKKRNDPFRRVAVVYENFVVIIMIKKRKNKTLSGEFITAFIADNSINKIRNNPKWKGLK